MFTFLFTVNVERIFRELLKRMRHLLDFWKIIRTLLQSMNSMCKLQKYNFKNIFYLFSSAHIYLFLQRCSSTRCNEEANVPFYELGYGDVYPVVSEKCGIYPLCKASQNYLMSKDNKLSNSEFWWWD